MGGEKVTIVACILIHDISIQTQSIQILKILNSFLEYISVIYVIDLFEPING